MDWHAERDLQVDALVVGGGFSGTYLLYKLRQAGLNTKLFEAGKELGGVWYWNRYPGARVDSEVPYYQYAIPEVWKTFSFSSRFPDHVELRRYFKHVEKTLDLTKDIAFEENVTDCTYDQAQRQWVVKTEPGRVARCRYLIVAAGSSYKRHYPDFKGLRDYEGTLLHAANFPADGVDFAGKRVAVIGQGATGLQIVQEVSKVASAMTVFVRTPNLALPMKQRSMTEEEQNSYRSIYQAIFKMCRQTGSGLPYASTDKKSGDVSPAERLQKWEELWGRGGFNFNIGNYRDYLFDQAANDRMYAFWKAKVHARIHDPAKRAILAPDKPPHPFGTKRSSLEQDYYECIDRPSVELVSLHTTPIAEFVKSGIVTSDGRLHECDFAILATGYDSLTGSFTGMGLKDKAGLDLKEKWQDGVRTHLGMTCPGLPNMFMVYSPQAPTALSNGTTCIEAQGDWIVAAITKMRAEGIVSIEAQAPAAQKWADDIQEMNAKTLFPLANSWYMGANIPGKKREQLVYLAGIQVYEATCVDALDGWKGFDLVY